jgi:multiple antibiotic resistance protein
VSHYFDAKFCLRVAVTLIVIMDPVGSVPVFLALTGGRTAPARARLAWQAVAVAGGVIIVFAFFGQQILRYLGIGIPALQGSGGLLLLLVALQLLTDTGDEPTQVNDEVSVALVPLGTPLIAGPGAIAAIIVYTREAHGFRDASAIALAVAATLILIWLTLRGSNLLLRLLREGGIHLLSRIFGLLVAAIAVQLVAESVTAYVQSGGA